MSNEIVTMGKSHIAEVILYDPKVDLVEVRLNSNKYPRIRSFSFEEAFPLMRNSINYLYLLKGQRAEDDVLDFMTGEMIRELQEENNLGTRNLSFYEINRAFRKAALNPIPGREMVAISVASLYHAVVDFIRTEGLEADRKAHDIREKEKRAQLSNPAKQALIETMAGAMVKAMEERNR